jgi:hypothetical protein
MLHPDGTWLIFSIGTVGVPTQHNCRKNGSSTTTTATVAGPKAGEFVQLHYATDPTGPWTFLNLTKDPKNPSIFDGGTNPRN